jgi:hypothetical protein
MSIYGVDVCERKKDGNVWKTIDVKYMAKG